jgi:hypothetical protein
VSFVLIKGSSTQPQELKALAAKPISHPPQKCFGDFRIYKINILENYL